MDGNDPGGWDDHTDDDWSDDADRIRGWIPPDDRLWRHPSEAASAPSGARPGATSRVRLAPHRGRSSVWAVGGTSVCVLLALLATGLIVVTTDTANAPTATTNGLAALTRTPTTEPGTGRLETHLASAVAAARPSTVAILVQKPGGTTMTTGLVAEAGGIIVTAAVALTGARTITVVEPDGSRQVAGVIGTDQTSGLAVLRIGDDLPAASFDENDPSPGDVTLALAMEPGSGSRHLPAPHVYAGTVVSSGRAVGGGTLEADFAPTALASPLTARDLGSPLLDASGDVSGVLAQVDSNGPRAMSVFLPSSVVLGVALQLVASGTVEHGWLGIEGADNEVTTTATTLTATTAPPNLDGAAVTAVEGDSPAGACGLEPGDLVIGVDGHQVHSMTELRARLYAEPPGTVLDITFERGGSVESTTAALGSASSDAQEAGTSP